MDGLRLDYRRAELRLEALTLFGAHVGGVGAGVGELLEAVPALERLVSGVDANVLLKEKEILHFSCSSRSHIHAMQKRAKDPIVFACVVYIFQMMIEIFNQFFVNYNKYNKY